MMLREWRVSGVKTIMGAMGRVTSWETLYQGPKRGAIRAMSHSQAKIRLTGERTQIYLYSRWRWGSWVLERTNTRYDCGGT